MGLGVTPEKRSRPGGPQDEPEEHIHTHTLLSLSHSGQSQFRYFDRNSTTRAQQKIKSLREKRAIGWWICQEGEIWVSGSPSLGLLRCSHTVAPKHKPSLPWAGSQRWGGGGGMVGRIYGNRTSASGGEGRVLPVESPRGTWLWLISTLQTSFRACTWDTWATALGSSVEQWVTPLHKKEKKLNHQTGPKRARGWTENSYSPFLSSVTSGPPKAL